MECMLARPPRLLPVLLVVTAVGWHVLSEDGQAASTEPAAEPATEPPTEPPTEPATEPWTELFDGRSLDGWRASERGNTWRVEGGQLVAEGQRSHLFYQGPAGNHDFRNFALQVEVRTERSADSGVLIHTRFQPSGSPTSGYEIQINNAQKASGSRRELRRTGGLHPVRNIYKPGVADGEWFRVRLSVIGRRIRVWVNDLPTVDYLEPDNPHREAADSQRTLSRGTIALQAPDPGGRVTFRSVKIRLLPDDADPDIANRASDAGYGLEENRMDRLAGTCIPVVDYHVHLRGGVTVDKATQRQAVTGINVGVLKNIGKGWAIETDDQLRRFLDSVRGMPVFAGLQVNDRDWMDKHSPELLRRLDYVLADTMIMPMPDDRSAPVRLWMADQYTIDDAEAWMERYVRHNLRVLSEPITILANPTYLPPAVEDQYDALWTDERMRRIIRAAIDNHVALEINARSGLPHDRFIRMAKQMGAKFTFGTNNFQDRPIDMSRCFQAVDRYGLTKDDMYVPAADDPPRPRFDVRKYATRGDGQTLDTAAIQRAIDACGNAGGGRVFFPAGNYLSGTLRLCSGVELHLAAGARLVGTTDLDAYGGFRATEGTPRLPQSRWHRGLIVGENLRDIAITGRGVIDGNTVFDPRGEEKMRGPHTILLGHCRGVALRDVTLRDSANYAFFFLHGRQVQVEHVTFEGGWDGVHFRGSPDAWNRHLRVSDCRFFTGDDCIAGHYIEDAVVRDCLINSSCNGVRLIGPARRLTLSRCEFFGPGKFEHRTSRRTNMLAALCLQPSAWGKQPGPLEDLRVSDVTMRDLSCAFHVVTRPGNTARRLTFERVRATGVYRAAASVESWGEPTFDDVLFRDVNVQYAGGGTAPDAGLAVRPPGVDARELPAWGFYLRGVRALTFERVRLATRQPDQRPVLLADGVDRLRLCGFQHPAPPAGVEPLVLHEVRQLDRDEDPRPPAPPQRTGGADPAR